MKNLAIVIVMLAVTVTAPAAIVDDFDSYVTGPLTEVSCTTWRPWYGVSGQDVEVVGQGLSTPNAIKHIGGEMGTSDVPSVVTYSGTGNLLGNLGDTATFSFDFYLREEGEQSMVMSAIWLGAGDPEANDAYYDNCICTVAIDYAYWDVADGATSVHVMDFNQELGGGDWGYQELTTDLALEQWHHVELIAIQTVADLYENGPNDADGTFEVWVNGALVTAAPLPFGFDDFDEAFGFNMIETYSYCGFDFAYNDYCLIDNISLSKQTSSPTVSAELTCQPLSGTLPFNLNIVATLTNIYTEFGRRIWANIDVLTADCTSFLNWKAGTVDLYPGQSINPSFSQYLPNNPIVTGNNLFIFTAVDVTPFPYNQPPFPPSGDTATSRCIVEGVAP